MGLHEKNPRSLPECPEALHAMIIKIAKNRKARYALLLLVVIVAAPAIYYVVAGRSNPSGATAAENDAAEAQQSVGARLVAAMPDTLRLEPATVKALGVQTVAAEAVTKPRLLDLHGSLALDTNQFVRVHSRFAGEVIALGEMPDYSGPVRAGNNSFPPVAFGDRVVREQLLAVVWCKDLGEKKSELADALSQLHFDQEQLAKMSDAARDGAVSEAKLRQQERNVEAGLTAVARAERTLRVWRLSESEIDAVKQEAERIRARKGKRDPEKEKTWARVEVRAPLEGIVVEKNVSVGDIVDTTTDLFKIANVDSLTVWANAYEENLPALLDLPAEKLHWTVRVNSDPALPPLKGRIDKIGYVTDPAQHTVMVMGRVDNPGGRLRAGQFITATVELPPLAHAVVVPAAAVVEDGRQSIVFVQPNPREPCYSLRQVSVAWRSQNEVHLRSRLAADESGRGLSAIQPGERVVAAAVIHLRSALDDLTAADKAPDKASEKAVD
jgi:cobalt-zinc-cadmium efflux system membrane fusion protein